MWSENETRRTTRVVKDPLFLLGLVFFALVLVTICVLSFLSLRMPKNLSAAPTKGIISESVPAVLPVSSHAVRLPVVLSGVVPTPGYRADSVSESIWKVVKIKKLGYEMDGRRYDVAVFKRLGSEETVKGYCINRGWDTPDVGAEYTLSTDGIFAPVSEDGANPLQRFQMIQ